MRVLETTLRDVKIFEPKVFEDERGFFFESYNAKEFSKAVGSEVQFVQDNHSRSEQNVLRGLHYQIDKPQAKLVRVVAGEIFDVAVDIRRSSPQFGKWGGERLSQANKRQMWIPEGFAHGFLVLSEYAEVVYKTGAYYSPEDERCIAWDDPNIAIEWPAAGSSRPILSPRDRSGALLDDAEIFS
jgi:dTDP-4-dehydrorhamnose 3,5-epimerase